MTTKTRRTSKVVEENRCEDNLSKVALVSIAVGFLVTTVCIMWPMRLVYTADPYLSAVENERLQLRHHRKLMTLYTVSICGMALVAFGGLIIGVLLIKYHVLEECRSHVKDDAYAEMPECSKDMDLRQGQEYTTSLGRQDPSLHATKATPGPYDTRMTPPEGGSAHDLLVKSDQLEKTTAVSDVKSYGAVQ